MIAPPMPGWQRRIDLAALMAIAVLGYAVGMTWLPAFRAAGGKQAFYQSEFSPAVAFVCGRGYVRLESASVPQLRAFLQAQVDRFSCADLPATTPTEPLTAFEAISRYLQLTVAAVWKLSGISWQALDVVLGVMYAVVCALSYALFRLAFGPIWALVGALAIVFSPVNLANLPHLRDYAKAPFLLALLLLTGLLVRRPNSTPKALVLSTLGGAVLGVGLGFRNDLLLAVVPLAFSVGGLSRLAASAAFRTRASMLACMVAAFAVTGYPILKAYGRSSNTPHVALLGLMTPFDTALGIRGSVYEFGYIYNDPFAALLVRGVVERDAPVGEFGPGLSDYDGATAAYLRRVAAIFPADLVVRAYASAASLVRTPFLGGDWAPTWLPSPVYEPLRVRAGLVRRSEWIVWLGCLVGLPLVLVQRTAAGLWLLMCLAVFGGGGAVQYQARHIFYLEVVQIAALLAGLDVMARVVAWAGRRGWKHGRADWRLLGAHTGVLLVLVLAPLALLWGTRALQAPRVRTLLEAYETAPAEDLSLSSRRLSADRMFVDVPARAPDPWPRAMSLLVVSFGGEPCPHDVVRPRFVYRFNDPYYDYSRELVVPLTPRRITEVVFPGFNLPGGPVELAGIELHAEDLVCLRGLRRITDDSRLAVPLVAILPPDWKSGRLYQQLATDRP